MTSRSPSVNQKWLIDDCDYHITQS